MYTHGPKTYNGRRLAPITTTLTLALWQIRHVWRLFLLITLGIVATVVLVCALPLFSQVNSTAGIRAVFNSGLYETNSFVQSDAKVASTVATNEATRHLTQGYQRIAGTFFHAPPVISLHVNGLAIMQNNHVIPKHVLQLHGYDFAHFASHITMIQGRLPRSNGAGLEVALTQDNAFSLDAQIGSVLTIHTTPVAGQQPLPVQMTVVGIFDRVSPFEDFWHGDMLESYTDQQSGITSNVALVSNAGLLTMFDTLAHTYTARPIGFNTNFFWYYPLDVTAIKSTNIALFQQQVDQLSADLPTQVTQVPFITNVTIINAGLKDLLQNGLNQNSTSQVPVIMLLALMLGLILFFVSVMTEILVNRQAEAIPLTSTRGASLG